MQSSGKERGKESRGRGRGDTAPRNRFVRAAPLAGLPFVCLSVCLSARQLCVFCWAVSCESDGITGQGRRETEAFLKPGPAGVGECSSLCLCLASVRAAMYSRD